MRAHKALTMTAVLDRLVNGPERHENRKRPIQLALGKVQVGSETRTLVWHPGRDVEIQVTKPGGGWIRDDKIEPSRVKRAFENLIGNGLEVKNGSGTGGPPAIRSIDLGNAAAELQGLDPEQVLRTFEKKLPIAARLQPEIG